MRDGAVAMGNIPPLLLHLLESWSEGYDESTAIVGACKAVELAASGIVVSLREAGAIAEGLHVRARARTPVVAATSKSRDADDELNYAAFKAAAEIVAEREQMGCADLSPDLPNSKSPTLPSILVSSNPVARVRR